jgi:hypothetical protein
VRPWLAFLALAWPAAPAAAAPPIATVEVVRDGERWTADYRLSVRAPVWVFAKSILPRESNRSWRLDTVRILTPGVSLKRIDHYDALVANKGYLPERVRLSFIPYKLDVEAGYDPALSFSDGSVAIYADGFKLVPVSSQAAALAAPKDESGLPAIDQPTRTIFVDRAGPVLAQGRRQARAVLDNGEAYVLFGKASPVIGTAMTTIIDPALPSWIKASLNRDMPLILADYRARLGPSPVGQPTLMVAWSGPTPGKVSLGGSVLPGLVVMTLEGEGLVTRNDKAARYANWFVAHEAAHFWLGQAVSYAGPAESWITEGGAELLAFRATAAADPGFDVRLRMSEAKAECLPFLARGGIADAYRREGDFRAYYACGAIIALAAEQASGGDFGSFVRALISRNAKDKIVTRAEWLALLEERAPGRGLSAARGGGAFHGARLD